MVSAIFITRIFNPMREELEVFDYYVDDLLSEDLPLLKGELDLLIIQYIFNSLDLDSLDNLYKYSENNYIAA